MITFKKFTEEDLPLFLKWAAKPHVKDVWFLDGYEAVDQYYKKTGLFTNKVVLWR